eukprot:1895790-Alexandrium_andersonii.AAC.1
MNRDVILARPLVALAPTSAISNFVLGNDPIRMCDMIDAAFVFVLAPETIMSGGAVSECLSTAQRLTRGINAQ